MKNFEKSIVREIREIVTKVSRGETPMEEAVSMLANMAVSGRILAVDDPMRDLEAELCQRHYMMSSVRSTDWNEDELKRHLGGHIFITRHGRRFRDGMKTYHYGLIWVGPGAYNAMALAARISQIVETRDFNHNLPQMVQIPVRGRFRRKN
ncbi:MAG: hypothetical protein V1809_00095 [Planctomycetota bacterium]